MLIGRRLTLTTTMRSDQPWSLLFLSLFLPFLVVGADEGIVLNTARYVSKPVRISHLFDNVATNDFDGRGHYYPMDILPTGVLKSENVNVWFVNMSFFCSAHKKLSS
jgi:hypothetical protein